MASGLDDLLGQLDATATFGREAGAIRADRGPRIPKLEHSYDGGWRPPPSKEEILNRLGGSDCCRRFNGTTCHKGDMFKTMPIMRPKVLGVWLDNYSRNCVPNRSIGNMQPRHSVSLPSAGIIKHHEHSEAFEATNDDQLHEQHRKWLDKHRLRRDQHLNPIYHALVRVDKAVEKEAEIQKMRETTVDLMTRGLLVKPNLSEGIKAKLNKSLGAVKTTRAFNKIKGIDNVADAHKSNQGILTKAMSQPVLAYKPATPRHRPRHLRSWKGTDRRNKWATTDVCLKHTTPGLAQQEEWELHNSPRYRARGA